MTNEKLARLKKLMEEEKLYATTAVTITGIAALSACGPCGRCGECEYQDKVRALVADMDVVWVPVACAYFEEGEA